jgi:hypothetical protein
MISGSKSGYRRRNPDNDISFNAKIFIPSGENVWYGDLDITLDAPALQEICNELQEEMIVVFEMLGSGKRGYEELETNAHAKFIPNEKAYLSRVYDGIHGVTVDNMTVITSKGVDWKPVKISGVIR